MGGDAYWDFNRGGSHCTVQEKVSKYGGKVGKGMGMGMGVGKAKEAQRNQQKMEGFKMTYEELGKEIGSLVDRKQKQYGDSYGKSGEILRVLYPNGVKPEEYGDMLGVVRILDKLFRIANGNQGEENAWIDISGYGLLGAKKKEEKEAEINFYD